MNYQKATDLIGKRDSKKLGNNTYLVRRGDDFAVKLHNTDVVTIHADNTYTLNTGGWQTVTTKDRINGYSPARIYQNKGLWYMRGGSVYYDGIRIDAAGEVISHVEKAEATEALKRKLDRMVSAYIKGFIEDMKKNGLRDPSSGDCWACCMRDEKGNTVMGISHIFEHFREKYYVPSLLWNALQRRGNPGFVWNYFKTRPEVFRSDLQHYFRNLKPELLQYMKENERGEEVL